MGDSIIGWIVTISFIVGLLIGKVAFSSTIKCEDNQTQILLTNKDNSTTWYKTEHKCGD